jgi:hypothetical protein
MNPELTKLRNDFDTLAQEFYRNNFSAVQDFIKYCRFNTRLKVPHYTADPATCEVGEIIEVSGKLKVCSAANTWTIVGTQS